MAIFTIGHSTHLPNEFIAMCKVHHIRTVLDVRSHPTSRWPWFGRDQMPDWLATAYIKYAWLPDLGGWNKCHAADIKLCLEMAKHGVDVAAYGGGKFPKQRIAKKVAHIPDESAPTWTNVGLWDYSWYTTLPQFVDVTTGLIHAGGQQHVAIMCAEALWWKCHRSMISDYLFWRGTESYHIMAAGKIPTPHSTVIGNRLRRYDPQIVRRWEQLKGA